ncbi:ribulose-phosphate 3-epimerase [bacterium]|nr:ribulose-phosphate 3-epimerase [bacterium]
MNKIIVAPSILSADFSCLKEEIEKVENSGADWIHVDVMDGHFVPNLTIGAPVVKCIRKITTLPLDVHLMIENPEKYLDDFISAGSDIITFHYETVENPFDLISKIKEKGIKAGISIKPKTEAEAILPYINELDLVLVMTVEPGFGGQKFMNECALKIKKIRENASDNLIIEVDGGINSETAKICKDYGANALVSGNYIYKAQDTKKAIESLR